MYVNLKGKLFLNFTAAIFLLENQFLNLDSSKSPVPYPPAISMYAQGLRVPPPAAPSHTLYGIPRLKLPHVDTMVWTLISLSPVEVSQGHFHDKFILFSDPKGWL